MQMQRTCLQMRFEQVSANYLFIVLSGLVLKLKIVIAKGEKKELFLFVFFSSADLVSC